MNRPTIAVFRGRDRVAWKNTGTNFTQQLATMSTKETDFGHDTEFTGVKQVDFGTLTSRSLHCGCFDSPGVPSENDKIPPSPFVFDTMMKKKMMMMMVRPTIEFCLGERSNTSILC